MSAGTQSTGSSGRGSIELIVHTPPNSGPDVMARALVEAASEVSDGRSWALVHRPGDHGAEAMRALLDAPGRGDVLSTCTPSFLQTPLLERLPFSYADLTPIAQLVADRYLLVVPTDRGPTDGPALLRQLRSEPTRTGGYMRGAVNELLALAIKEAIDAQPVEYVLTTGPTDLVPALLEGRLDWAVGTPVEIMAAVNDGMIRPLAALAPTRSPAFPGVPTGAELGIAMDDIVLWRGLMGPPGLPVETVERWVEMLRRLESSQRWRSYLEANAQQQVEPDPDAFRDLLDRQHVWFARQLALAGLTQ